MNIFNIKISKSLIILLIFSIILNILRIVIWDKYSFVYILWNIFLAIVPFVISYTLLKINNRKRLSKLVFFCFFIIWLIFIPNSPYILTDFIHLGEIRIIPVLYDAILLFVSAYVGIMFGVYSIKHIENILKTMYSTKISFSIVTLIVFIMSFGVYVGRFLRFNSWDMFAKPVIFINGIKEILQDSDLLIESFLYTLLFFSFIFIFYLSQRNKNDSNI